MNTANIYVCNTEILPPDEEVLPDIPPYYVKKYEKANNPKVKKQELAAGYLLAIHLGVIGEDGIIENEYGKPMLNPDTCINIKEFSISHSGKYVVLAVADKPVGVDIEDSDRMSLPVLKKVLPEEYYDILIGKEFPVEEEFMLGEKLGQAKAWTTVEAMLKAEGCGFKMDPKKDPGLFDRWYTSSVIYDKKYVITCAYGDPLFIKVN